MGTVVSRCACKTLFHDLTSGAIAIRGNIKSLLAPEALLFIFADFALGNEIGALLTGSIFREVVFHAGCALIFA